MTKIPKSTTVIKCHVFSELNFYPFFEELMIAAKQFSCFFNFLKQFKKSRCWLIFNVILFSEIRIWTSFNSITNTFFLTNIFQPFSISLLFPIFTIISTFLFINFETVTKSIFSNVTYNPEFFFHLQYRVLVKWYLDPNGFFSIF